MLYYCFVLVYRSNLHCFVIRNLNQSGPWIYQKEEILFHMAFFIVKSVFLNSIALTKCFLKNISKMGAHEFNKNFNLQF